MGGRAKTVGAGFALALSSMAGGCSDLSAGFPDTSVPGGKQSDNEDDLPWTIGEALGRIPGEVSDEVITLADGNRYVVDALYTRKDGRPSGYVLAGRLDGDGNIVEIAEWRSTTLPYVPGTTSGVFEYSGPSVALLGRDGASYNRVAGTAEMTVDFDSQEARLEAGMSSADVAAELAGVLAFDRESGRLSADGLSLEYSDQAGNIVGTADLEGAVSGDNAGFAAFFEAADGVRGTGVMSGERDH